MNGGTEWIVDAFDCEPSRLRDRALLVELCDGIVHRLDLRVVGAPQVHRFGEPGGGVTALYLLAESHLACHTFPETGIATFNLYCCRDRAPLGPGFWDERLAAALGARRVTVVIVRRGAST